MRDPNAGLGFMYAGWTILTFVGYYGRRFIKNR